MLNFCRFLANFRWFLPHSVEFWPILLNFCRFLANLVDFWPIYVDFGANLGAIWLKRPSLMSAVRLDLLSVWLFDDFERQAVIIGQRRRQREEQAEQVDKSRGGNNTTASFVAPNQRQKARQSRSSTTTLTRCKTPPLYRPSAPFQSLAAVALFATATASLTAIARLIRFNQFTYYSRPFPWFQTRHHLSCLFSFIHLFPW